jgi:hypothetical protein
MDAEPDLTARSEEILREGLGRRETVRGRAGRMRRYRPAHQCRERQRTVPGRRSVTPLEPAAHTLVYQNVLATLEQHAHRLHQPAALRRPIPRRHVHVHRPQATRAVIRVPITAHRRPAVGADEILAPPGEPGATARPARPTDRRLLPNPRILPGHWSMVAAWVRPTRGPHMTPEQFRAYGYQVVGWIAQY